ncbi:Meckel syndrome type 1 protein homolog isoform X1 [Anopheles merus]|uniref:Meckel syndrome type 1 protein homolog isoform X1 n=1 Tax=Anopheles merus TaxID=30066 RepID=UPI001BE42942|nr:Meckel syndrome type 1 protein homolog isoform X1 [Anopheles merus]
MFTNKKQFKTGVYRTKGSISNFRCRLTIRKIHSLIDVPNLEGLDKSLDATDLPENGSYETRIISWQEKIFSQYEKDYYRIKENCKTDHQKKYYQMLKAEPHEPQLLFTYVDADNYYPDEQNNAPQLQLSKLMQNKTQSFHLMADLGREVLLYTLTWNPEEGIMTVFPDFNNITTNPLYQEMRESNLHMYHYALERYFVEKPFTPVIKNHVACIGKSNILMFPTMVRKDRFEIPKQLHRNLLILLEIVRATNFDYDGIHIRYRINLPVDIKMANKNSELTGSTHASKQLNGFWHFGHCHELLLNVPITSEVQLSVDVYFEAISIDSWCRERYLGHAHLSIPLRSQINETTINFMQLTNVGSMADRMEVFLVGNRRQVDLPAFYGMTGATIINRYANESSSSGRLQIQFQTVQQHLPKILNEGYFKIAKKTKNITLKELITSYNAARERLEEFVDLQY